MITSNPPPPPPPQAFRHMTMKTHGPSFINLPYISSVLRSVSSVRMIKLHRQHRGTSWECQNIPAVGIPAPRARVPLWINTPIKKSKHAPAVCQSIGRYNLQCKHYETVDQIRPSVLLLAALALSIVTGRNDSLLIDHSYRSTPYIYGLGSSLSVSF